MIKIEFNEIGSSMELSGHMYKGSAYETANSCGNCDGARCENCEKVYNLYNKVTYEDIPINIDDENTYILKQLVDTRDLHYGYYMIEFSYSSILFSEDKKLYDIIHKAFVQAYSIDDKNRKVITYHIIVANDDVDMEYWLNEEIQKANIESFTIIKIISNKIQEV